MKHRLYLSAGLALVVMFSQAPAPRAQQPTASIAVRTRDVGGVKLQYSRRGKAPRSTAARLRGDVAHVASPHPAIGGAPHGDCA